MQNLHQHAKKGSTRTYTHSYTWTFPKHSAQSHTTAEESSCKPTSCSITLAHGPIHSRLTSFLKQRHMSITVDEGTELVPVMFQYHSCRPIWISQNFVFLYFFTLGQDFPVSITVFHFLENLHPM